MIPLKKLLFLSSCVLLGCVLTACTYHGHVRRGFYPAAPATANRLNTSVLVLSGSLPSPVTLADPDKPSLYSYSLDVADGVLVATTDALGTLVTQADAGPAQLASNYKWVAQVTLDTQLTRSDCTSTIPQTIRQNGLCTQLTLTLYRALSQQPVGVFTAKRWVIFQQPGLASGLWWLNARTFSLLSPILMPTYTQLQGAHLRKQFEQQMTEILQEITQQMQTPWAQLETNPETKTAQAAQNYVK